MLSTPPQLKLLIIEDSLADQKLIAEFLHRWKPSSDLVFVSDGTEAIEYLRQMGKYRDASVPSLILLDLNLPRKDGRQVLAEIKADQALMHIPVIVFTSSSNPDDVEAVYKHHANCYLIKPSDLDEFEALMKQIQQFWVQTVVLSKSAG